MTWRSRPCDLVLPCHDEAAALPALLAEVPPGLRGDRGRQRLARRDRRRRRAPGARVVSELAARVRRRRPRGSRGRHRGPRRGDGRRRVLRPRRAASRCSTPSANGDVRPGARPPTPDRTRRLAVARPARQRPGGRGGCAVRSGFPVHDLAPMRVCRRADLLDLDVRDRRFGYPLELLRKATLAGWRLEEYDVTYRPRAAGTRSKVSGSLRGTMRTARDFWKVLSGGAMRALVIAKAPVPGRVKTRLGTRDRHGGGGPRWPPPRSSTRSPPAARRSTSATSRSTAPRRTPARRTLCVRSLDGWIVHPQRGDGVRRAPGARACRRRRARGRPSRSGWTRRRSPPRTCTRGGRGRGRRGRRARARRRTAAGGYWLSATRPRRRSWPTYRCRGPTPSPAPARRWSAAGQTVGSGTS